MSFPRSLPSILILALASILLPPSPPLLAEWQPPEVRLPDDRSHPVITLPPGALDRLRAAYSDEEGAFFRELSNLVAAGERSIAAPLSFPPRGGLHNMWYQCDDCEAPLHTVTETEHKCRLCERTYSGHPYDDVVFARRHGANLNRLRDAAWAYALTGDEKFAIFAKTVLIGYAERYLNYPYRHASLADHEYARRAGAHISDQTLTEASRLLRQIAPSYDLIHNSPSISEEEHETIREKLFRPMLKVIGANRRGMSNWQSFHNAAMFWAGAVLGETEWMERSINDPEHGFLYQMEASLTPDGMWHEGSWSYHFYTLIALAHHARGASHLGIDLWQHPQLKKMFSLPVNYEMADGTVPRFGNATSLRPRQYWQSQAELTEAAYRAYQDISMLPVLPPRLTRFSLIYENDKTPRNQAVELPSIVFPETGHAMLRTTGEAGLTAAFTFAPYGGYHGHFDKLSFVLFGFGEELAVDRGRAASQAYRLPIHNNWYKATISHNTVLVDGNNQAPVKGDLLFFEAKKDYTAVVASCDEAYPGVFHRRLLCLTPGYLLVFDQLRADRPRRFDWFYHNRGETAETAAAINEIDLSKLGPGFHYIQDTRSGISQDLIKAAFPGEQVHTRLVEAGAPATRVTIGHGPGSSVDERIPLLFLTRQGREANFAAVIEPAQKGVAAEVDSITWRETDRGIMIEVDRGARKDRFFLHLDGKVSVRLSE